MDDQPIHPAIRGLKTVCRCNNIKYRTIERAIREGARTIADVAQKTGATTGHCGGSCTPDIQAMLAELASGSVPVSVEPSLPVPVASQPVEPHGTPNANAWWVRKS